MIERTLSYGKQPIRIHVTPDGWWLAAYDIFRATKCDHDREYLSYFDPAHLRRLTFSSTDGPAELTAVSPLGAATIALGLYFPSDRILDATIRKWDRDLAAEFGFAPMGWTVLADGRLPVKPGGGTELFYHWKGLEMQVRDTCVRRDPNFYEPALFDNAPGVPPHDPEALFAEVAAANAKAEANPQPITPGPVRYTKSRPKSRRR